MVLLVNFKRRSPTPSCGFLGFGASHTHTSSPSTPSKPQSNKRLAPRESLYKERDLNNASNVLLKMQDDEFLCVEELGSCVPPYWRSFGRDNRIGVKGVKGEGLRCLPAGYDDGVVSFALEIIQAEVAVLEVVQRASTSETGRALPLQFENNHATATRSAFRTECHSYVFTKNCNNTMQ